MNYEELVLRYTGLRQEKSELKQTFEEASGRIVDQMNQIEGFLLKYFQDNTLESIKTSAGTAYKTTRSFYKTEDDDSFRAFASEPENWAFAKVTPVKAAVDEYVSEHGELPPGVGAYTETVVNIRKS